jgi:hypothetical protein
MQQFENAWRIGKSVNIAGTVNDHQSVTLITKALFIPACEHSKTERLTTAKLLKIKDLTTSAERLPTKYHRSADQ